MRQLATILVIFLIGCSAEVLDADAALPDAGHIVEHDAEVDASTVESDATVGADARVPVVPDAGRDAGADAGRDAGRDAGPADAGSDSGADSGSDAGAPDAGVDAGSDARPPDAGPMDSGPPPADRTAAVSLALGAEHSCLLRTSGNVHCWGYPSAPGVAAAEPLTIGAVDIAASRNATCALLAGGAARCWTTSMTTPTVPAMDVIATHCGITTGGEPTCWSPATGPAATPNTIAIDTFRHEFSTAACAVRADMQTVDCWGGSAPASPSPFTSGISRVTVGSGHACVIAGGGAVWCWGNNGRGQCGNWSLRSGLPPTMTGGAVGYVEIAAGGQHTCGRRSDGSVWCWGDNTHGQLGRVTALSYDNNPGEVLLAGARMNATTLGVGTNHACAALSDGRIVCWGSNASGALGRWVPGGMTTEPVEPESFWTE